MLPCCWRRAPGTPAAGRRCRLRVRPGVLRGGARRGGGKGKPMPPLQMPARSSGHVAPSPSERTAWKSHRGKYLGEAFLSGGFFKSGGRICLRRRKKLSGFSGLLEGRLHGEQLYLQRNAKHLIGRGSPRALLLPWCWGCPAGSGPGRGPAGCSGARTGQRPAGFSWSRPWRRQLGRSPQAGGGGTRGCLGTGEAAGSCSGLGRAEPGSAGGRAEKRSEEQLCTGAKRRGRREGTMTTKPETFRLLKSLLELLTLWVSCWCVTDLTGGVR